MAPRYHCPDFKQVLEGCAVEVDQQKEVWNDKANLAFVTNLTEVDFARFRDGFHLVNHIQTRFFPSYTKNFLLLIEH